MNRLPKTHDWRGLASEEKWSEIEHLRLSIKECEELLETLMKIVPTRVFGDGVNTYRDYINPKDADTWPLYHAATLLRNTKSHVRFLKEREGVDEGELTPIEQAVEYAISILSDYGVDYEGINDTYIYYQKGAGLLGGNYVQIRGDIGAAIFKKRMDNIYELEPELAVMWKILYPWRSANPLRDLIRFADFEPYTLLWYALEILYAEEQLKFTVDEIHEGFERVAITEQTDRLIKISAYIGRYYEAALKKEYEEPAIAELKAKEGRRRGGNARAQSAREKADKIISAMQAQIDNGKTVNAAARIVFEAQKLGTSQGANSKIWYRYQ